MFFRRAIDTPTSWIFIPEEAPKGSNETEPNIKVARAVALDNEYRPAGKLASVCVADSVRVCAKVCIHYLQISPESKVRIVYYQNQNLICIMWSLTH